MIGMTTIKNKRTLKSKTVLVLLVMTGMMGCEPSRSTESPNATKAFYLGHSLSDGVPELVWGLSKSNDAISFDYGYQRINGSPLRHQYNLMREIRYPASLDETDRAMLKTFDSVTVDHYAKLFPFFDEVRGLPSGGYTHLVMTESVPRYKGDGWGNIEDTYRLTDSLYQFAIRQNPDIKPYLYEVWHCIKSGTPTGCYYDKDSSPFRQRLTDDLPMWEEVVNRFNQKNPRTPMKLIPVGQAIGNLSDAIDRREVPGINSIGELFTDDIHVNDTLRYLSACVHYATLLERSPVGLTNKPSKLSGEPFITLPEELAQLIQKIAWETVQSYQNKKED